MVYSSFSLICLCFNLFIDHQFDLFFKAYSENGCFHLNTVSQKSRETLQTYQQRVDQARIRKKAWNRPVKKSASDAH